MNLAQLVGATEGYSGLNGIVVAMGKVNCVLEAVNLYDPSFWNQKESMSRHL